MWNFWYEDADHIIITILLKLLTYILIQQIQRKIALCVYVYLFINPLSDFLSGSGRRVIWTRTWTHLLLSSWGQFGPGLQLQLHLPPDLLWIFLCFLQTQNTCVSVLWPESIWVRQSTKCKEVSDENKRFVSTCMVSSSSSGTVWIVDSVPLSAGSSSLRFSRSFHFSSSSLSPWFCTSISPLSTPEQEAEVRWCACFTKQQHGLLIFIFKCYLF